MFLGFHGLGLQALRIRVWGVLQNRVRFWIPGGVLYVAVGPEPEPVNLNPKGILDPSRTINPMQTAMQTADKTL